MTRDEVVQLARQLPPDELLLAVRGAMRLNPAVRAEVHGLVNEWLFERHRRDGVDREAER